ncbi:hypothetical protein [Noviherbaspirillum saxi]|uniref:Transmembrane protein n=1 Tax=Noviherbaspirillum saxi TaxID=2320863 RepID=A0A3A3FNK2_9BURK|nr:hypothetical protein [Noviherbaspirillum saxi]RJF97473.1 hypothetical protein D3871_02210 [Noviherbaspirillum saxi]
MAHLSYSFLRKAACIAAAALLLACSPKYDWREVRSPDANFQALFPGKPSSHSRAINLDGIQVTMTMTAADVDGASFAVGSATLADAAQAAAALTAMKTAMIRNMGGTVRHDKTVSSAGAPAMTEVEIAGPSPSTASDTRLMVARFIVKDRRVYQIVVVGQEKNIPREQIDTFFTSFKPG